MSSTPTPNTTDEMAGSEQPFMAHLIELRDRLMRALIAIGVIALILAIWPGPQALYDQLAAPLLASINGEMISIHITAPVLVPIKTLMMTAFLIALPFVLYQVWAFVAPGLYRKEKMLILPLAFSSVLLFFVGMAFCYFFVFKKVFAFIMSFAPESIRFAPDMSEYLDFVLTMFLAFGMAFEVPIVVVVLVRLGFVTLEKLKSIRGYIIVASFVVAAVVTPPDVVSQLALAIPMCILYELGLLVSKFIAPKKTDDDEYTSDVKVEGESS